MSRTGRDADNKSGMKDFAAPRAGERGSALLLRHCAALTDVDRVCAYTRLELLVGADLARMLVAALAPRVREPVAA
jgi:hypothetical protein